MSYFLYDRRQQVLSSLFSARPELAGYRLAPSLPVLTRTGHRIGDSLKTCESKAARKDGYASIVPSTGSRLDIPAR